MRQSFLSFNPYFGLPPTPIATVYLLLPFGFRTTTVPMSQPSSGPTGLPSLFSWKSRSKPNTSQQQPSHSDYHCKGCICSTLQPERHPDDAHLTHDPNGDLWGTEGLLTKAQQAATDHITGTNGKYRNSLRQFSLVASLFEKGSKYDLGIKYITWDKGWTEEDCRAERLAHTIRKLGQYPSRAEAIVLVKEHQDVLDHLLIIDADSRDAQTPSKTDSTSASHCHDPVSEPRLVVTT